MTPIPPDRFLDAARAAGVLADDARGAAIERAVTEAEELDWVVDVGATLVQRGVISEVDRAAIERAAAAHLTPAPDEETLLDIGATEPDDSTTMAGSHGPAAAPATGPAALTDKSRYDYGAVIGAGGVGEIRVVTDRRIGRQVAMKTLHKPDNRAHRLRFEREAQVTGQLEHPFIVPVHEAGADADGKPYFTMKLVRGRTLSEWLRDADATLREHPEETGRLLSEKIEIFHRICDAVGYAHAHGVIHRDLKPANVMIGEFGEVLVMDWGLAARFGVHASPDDDQPAPDDAHAPVRLDAQHDTRILQPQLTADGALIGTPAYMSPEQALGEISTLDERSDIYALGAILYEMLTHTSPFRGTDTLDVLRQVMAGELQPPVERAPDRRIPVDLDDVVRTAMARQREDRFRSVGDLQARLRGVAGSRVEREIAITRHLGQSQLAVIALGRTARMLIAGMNRVLRPFGSELATNNVLRMLVGAGDAGLTVEDMDQRMIGYVDDLPALVQQLCERGLARPHPDRPGRYLVADPGRELVAEARKVTDPFVASLLSDMSDDEQRQLTALLERARDSIQRHGGADSRPASAAE